MLTVDGQKIVDQMDVCVLAMKRPGSIQSMRFAGDYRGGKHRVRRYRVLGIAPPKLVSGEGFYAPSRPVRFPTISLRR